MKTKARYTVLDALRGVAVIAMVIYHTLWDLTNIFDVNMPWFGSGTAKVFQLSIRWAFILISGFSWCLGKKHLRRSLTVIGASVIITLVTAVFMPEDIIIFGVLSLIGTGMLLTIPLDKVFKKIPPYIGIIVCALLFVLCYNVPSRYIGVGDTVLIRLPAFLYCHTLTAYIGFVPVGFYSADYVPLLPWLFLFWIGYFLYRACEKYNLLKLLSVFSVKPLEFIGRHALIIYMVHQPAVYGVLMLLFWIIG